MFQIDELKGRKSMSRSIVIMVCDQTDLVESNRRHYQNQPDVTFQSFTTTQWREGLENPFFRQQLNQGVPALALGVNPIQGEGQVIAFPTTNPEHNVLKMDDIEAKAIENAILQYKGNLTEAAKALGIGRATLYRKVKQYHIDPSVARKRKMAA